MAWSNIFRQKKKTVVLTLSLSLALILLLSVFTVIHGFSVDAYAKRELGADCVVASNNLITNGQLYSMDQKPLQDIREQPEVQDAYPLYYQQENTTLSEKAVQTVLKAYQDKKIKVEDWKQKIIKAYVQGKRDYPTTENRYGWDYAMLKRCTLKEGTLDQKEYDAGKSVVIAKGIGCWDDLVPYHAGG